MEVLSLEDLTCPAGVYSLEWLSRVEDLPGPVWPYEYCSSSSDTSCRQEEPYLRRNPQAAYGTVGQRRHPPLSASVSELGFGAFVRVLVRVGAGYQRTRQHAHASSESSWSAQAQQAEQSNQGKPAASITQQFREGPSITADASFYNRAPPGPRSSVSTQPQQQVSALHLNSRHSYSATSTRSGLPAPVCSTISALDECISSAEEGHPGLPFRYPRLHISSSSAASGCGSSRLHSDGVSRGQQVSNELRTRVM